MRTHGATDFMSKSKNIALLIGLRGSHPYEPIKEFIYGFNFNVEFEKGMRLETRRRIGKKATTTKKRQLLLDLFYYQKDIVLQEKQYSKYCCLIPPSPPLLLVRSVKPYFS